ncbi:hypothetical protein M231_07976 [Tremella mesenterica]|uniref:Uncharacterized protein n=1 Tax=Tremella mesenterica TaxID=5217 RepID=A0A4Q1BF86_TREME|nr:hypothetical protein M231_07976 [Tremella mesenterica]
MSDDEQTFVDAPGVVLPSSSALHPDKRRRSRHEKTFPPESPEEPQIECSCSLWGSLPLIATVIVVVSRLLVGQQKLNSDSARSQALEHIERGFRALSEIQQSHNPPQGTEDPHIFLPSTEGTSLNQEQDNTAIISDVLLNWGLEHTQTCPCHPTRLLERTAGEDDTRTQPVKDEATGYEGVD